MTKKATVYLESISDYSQSKYIDPVKHPKLPREASDDYEARTWRERCHYDREGMLYIPPMVFANNIKEAAKFLSIRIPGGGQTTYTKHFESGVMVLEPLPLNIHKDKVESESFFVPSNGVRGAGKRVLKTFPMIRHWEGIVEYWSFDDTVTEGVFRQVLDAAGQLIGIGRFRPRNLGTNGRFQVNSIKWEEYYAG